MPIAWGFARRGRFEWLCERDIGFRVIAANHSPDHTMIGRFRKEKGEALKSLFMQVLRSEAFLLVPSNRH